MTEHHEAVAPSDLRSRADARRDWLRRAAARSALLLAASGLLGACTLQNLSSQTRFSDSAYALNDATRWGEVDIAAQHVAAKYRSQFLARRSAWGERVSIADLELSMLKLGEDKKRAVSEVTLSWYDHTGVIIHKSSITQRWESQRGDYRLVDETIARGDQGVFADDPASPRQSGQ